VGPLSQNYTVSNPLQTRSRPRAFLRKSRPSTANMLDTTDQQDYVNPTSPSTPSRPATSHAFLTPETARTGTPFTTPGRAQSTTPFASARSRHTIHFAPDSDPVDHPHSSISPLSARPHTPHRWSTLVRPKSRQRPSTSGGLLEGTVQNERPTTSAGERMLGGDKKADKRRSWSLRKLFK